MSRNIEPLLVVSSKEVSSLAERTPPSDQRWSDNQAVVKRGEVRQMRISKPMLMVPKWISADEGEPRHSQECQQLKALAGNWNGLSVESSAFNCLKTDRQRQADKAESAAHRQRQSGKRERKPALVRGMTWTTTNASKTALITRE